MSKEAPSNFAEVMNKELEQYIVRWKNFPNEKVHDTLNELFLIAMLVRSEVELRVKPESIFEKESDAMDPQAAMILGKADGNDWVFIIPPIQELRDGPEDYLLCVIASSQRTSRLCISQLDHSLTARFKPEDVISVKIK